MEHLFYRSLFPVGVFIVSLQSNTGGKKNTSYSTLELFVTNIFIYYMDCFIYYDQ